MWRPLAASGRLIGGGGPTVCTAPGGVGNVSASVTAKPDTSSGIYPGPLLWTSALEIHLGIGLGVGRIMGSLPVWVQR
jgi:hypothetical protein